MSNITQLQQLDDWVTSREIINTNINNLNTDKLDKITDTLDDIPVWVTNKHINQTQLNKIEDWVMLTDTDCDTVTTWGRYWMIWTPVNWPQAWEFYLEVLSDWTRIMQIATYLDNTVWTRYYNWTVWSTWIFWKATWTNTWDQTSIVWITWTKAQFNTAVTDDDFAYQSDLLDENIGASASATNYTPTWATVEWHLAWIDTALASAWWNKTVFIQASSWFNDWSISWSWNNPAVILADWVTDTIRLWWTVPSWFTSISSIKLHWSTGWTWNVYLSFASRATAEWVSINTWSSTDSIAWTTYAVSATSQWLDIIDISAVVDNLTLTPWYNIWLQIQREWWQAADTISTTYLVYWIEIIYS